MYYESENYLAHHGIKDQKWGNRRFQNKDGSLTPEGRIRYGVGEPRDKKRIETSNTISKLKEKVKQQYSKKEAIKKQKEKEKNEIKENVKNEDHELLKKHVRERPKDLYKYRSEFTKDEIEELISAIDYDRKLKDISDEEVRRVWSKINQFSNNLGTLSNLASNSINLWNNAASINNALITAGVLNKGKIMEKVNTNQQGKKQKNNQNNNQQNQQKNTQSNTQQNSNNNNKNKK